MATNPPPKWHTSAPSTRWPRARLLKEVPARWHRWHRRAPAVSAQQGWAGTQENGKETNVGACISSGRLSELLPRPGSNRERREVSAGLGNARGPCKPQGCQVCWGLRGEHGTKTGPGGAARSLRASGSAPVSPLPVPLPPTGIRTCYRHGQQRGYDRGDREPLGARTPRAATEHWGRFGSKTSPRFPP